MRETGTPERVSDLVPAWFSNRISSLVKAPKRYLVDPALVTAVLGLGRDAILYGPDMLGCLPDTFAAGIVLHTGPHAFPVSDRIVAAPVSTLWS